MPREIKMPKLSDTMEEGTINVWRKSEGDAIAKGDVLVEVETDKADMEYEAYMSGSLARILVPAGETVSVGTPIAIVRLERDSDEDLQRFLADYGQAPAERAVPVAPQAAAPAPSEAAPPPVAAAPAASPAPTPEPSAPASPASAGPGPIAPSSRIAFFVPDPERVRATPRARVLARERSVDLSEIAGSGPEGAIRVSDVERYLEALESSEPPRFEGDVPVTPVAARIAEEQGIDLSRVKATGPGGRITKRDLQAHLEQEAREGTERERSLHGDEIKLSQKRKFLIRQMVESKQQVPHFYISMDVDAEPMRALRGRFKAEERHVTYTHMIVKAAALALERYPDANATYRDGRILRYDPINVAVAVDVQDELVAPVVKDCQGVNLDELARRTDALIEKAREKKLAPEDYSDGTFSVSNLGMLGVDHFYAIITPPQSMVLSVGGVRQVACVTSSGAIEAGSRIDFGLACDHRVVDGAKAARVLEAIREVLEDPARLVEERDG